MADEKVKLIRVRSGRDDNRVAIWDVDPLHPTGEIFVAGDRVVEAALTPAVERALASGELLETAEPAVVEEVIIRKKTREEVLAEIKAAGGKVPGERGYLWTDTAPKPATPQAWTESAAGEHSTTQPAPPAPAVPKSGPQVSGKKP